VRRHAKASTAGSTQRQATGLGRVFRGADATRGVSSDANGSSASAPAARRLVLPVSVFAALVALMVVAIPASATKTHLFKETFGSAAQPSFSLARSVAVNQSTGDVLVMDAGGTPSIKRFKADGTADSFSALGTNVIDGKGSGDETPQNGLSFASASESQIAVDNSGTATDGDIYVTQGSPSLINIFSGAGAYLGQLTKAGATNFTKACGVAVDSAGAVYVGDYSGGIRKFVPAANPPVNTDNTATFTTTTQPCNLAAGSGATAGFLFPAQYNGPISKIDSATGELKYTVSSGSNTTVSVDPGTGHVYATTGSTIKELDASGAGSATSVSSFSLEGSVVQGLAVRGSSGNVYVSRSGNAKVEVFGPLVTIPGVTTGSASGIEKTTATLNGTVNPDGVELSECKFEYGKTTGYGQSAPCTQSPATIGTGTSDVAVSANLSGLELGAEYHFRLVARNPSGTVNGADSAFKLKSPPAIREEWSQNVTFTEAALKAKINPEGFASTFHFEYGTSASYGQSTAEASVGSNKADHTVTVFLEGLQPATTYHYRVVATNSIGISNGADRTFTTYAHEAQNTSCPNQAFRTGPATGLPDCRGYEMVSPVDKNGGNILGLYNNTLVGRAAFEQSSLSGEKITYSSNMSFGDEPSASAGNQYMGTRGPDGWLVHGISPPRGPSVFGEEPVVSYDFDSPFLGFSEDLSSAWVLDDNVVPLTADGIAGYGNLYRRSNSNDGFEALSISKPAVGFDPDLEFRDASPDNSHQVFDVRAALTPDAPANETRRVYDLSGGKLHLVSVLPNGTAATGESITGTKDSDGGYSANGHNSRTVSVKGALADDGSWIFWSTEASPRRLYVRENPAQTQSALNGSGECTEPAKACTTLVSSNAAPSTGKARFWAADPRGSVALFSENTGAPGAFDDLYKFDITTKTRSLIAHEVSGVLGASDDLSYIYFVSKENLAAGGTPGGYNLYLDHEGTMSFVATLSALDLGQNAISAVAPNPFLRDSRVTPDGRHIAFMSSSKALSEAVAGYDNTDAVNGNADMEAYLYEAGGELICASCNPSGSRPLGGKIPVPYTPFEETTGVWGAAWIPTWEHEQHASRALSDDGKRLFFNSFDALLPQDNNGVQDVYEWEAQGVGGCQKPSGCVSLISTGESAKGSEFVDADAGGNNAFFRTSESIDPRDPSLIDIYDARVDGGFPLPPRPPECTGDACQGSPEAPRDPTPASAGFRGAGNPAPRKARRNCRARSGAKKARHEKAQRCKHAKRGAKR